MSKRAAISLSSGSEGGGGEPHLGDERKKKRMLSNRESARRSRMRKQQHLDELLNQAAQLQKENDEIVRRVNQMTEIFSKFDSENNILRAQMAEWTDRLQSLNSVLRVIEEISGFPIDIPEIPDPLLKPWQLSITTNYGEYVPVLGSLISQAAVPAG